MTKLRFPADSVNLLMVHARASNEHSLTFGERLDLTGSIDPQDGEEKLGQPGLLIVKDDGIYLVSNGFPAMLDPDRPGKKKVVYALGYSPDDPGFWERSRDAVGGDDFVEVFHLDELPEKLKPGSTFELEITDEQIACDYFPA